MGMDVFPQLGGTTNYSDTFINTCLAKTKKTQNSVSVPQFYLEQFQDFFQFTSALSCADASPPLISPPSRKIILQISSPLTCLAMLTLVGIRSFRKCIPTNKIS
ncbi:hypothetical protein CDAR_436131 [Caerostris darwini]|uniref:Uncharacterized protein n=1 Tax=Caerostris darwini TaxID=1538125 RepID=A0AAV4PBS4_9ARAC|nr:hypothetical protein CDAR_436131 [Caerostris darwini]